MAGLLPEPNGDPSAQPDPSPAPNPNPNPDPSPNPDPNPDPGAVARPDWLPEAAWDAEKNEVLLDKLGEHVGSIGKDSDVPAEATGYQPPKIEGVEPDLIAQDPVYQAMAKVAHQRGIGQEAFSKFVQEHVEQTIAAEEANAKEEKGKLGEKADERLQAVSNWLGSKLPKEKVAAVRHLTVTAEGVEALELLMNGQVSSAPRTPPGETSKRKSLEEIRALQAKPEYYDPAKRDPTVVKEVNDWYAAEYAEKK